MKFNKKGEQAASSGVSAIVIWGVIIIAVLILIAIIINFTDVGKLAWSKITDNSFAYV